MAVSIKGLSKAVVLAALYNRSSPQGMGWIQATLGPMGTAEAEVLVTAATHGEGENKSIYFDYLKGRVMKVDLGPDELQTHLYDRDVGQGAAEAVINALRATTPAAA